MTESESVALPFGDSPLFVFRLLIARDECYYITGIQKKQPLFLIFFKFLQIFFLLILCKILMPFYGNNGIMKTTIYSNKHNKFTLANKKGEIR